MTWHTCLTALDAAILDESCIAETEVGSRADAIGTSIGTVSDAHERIVHVLDISSVTVTDIGTTADSIQAGLITVCHTTRVGRIKGPSRGARALLRRDTLSTATSTAADRLTDAQDILRESLLAGTDIGTDAISVLASIAADGKTLLVRRV